MCPDTMETELVDTFWLSHNAVVYSASMLTSDLPHTSLKMHLKLFVKSAEVHSQICHAIAFCFWKVKDSHKHTSVYQFLSVKFEYFILCKIKNIFLYM